MWLAEKYNTIRHTQALVFNSNNVLWIITSLSMNSCIYSATKCVNILLSCIILFWSAPLGETSFLPNMWSDESGSANALKLWQYKVVISTSSWHTPSCPYTTGVMAFVSKWQDSEGWGHKSEIARGSLVSHICHQGLCKSNALLRDWHSGREISTESLTEILPHSWNVFIKTSHIQTNHQKQYVRGTIFTISAPGSPSSLGYAEMLRLFPNYDWCDQTCGP